MRPSAPHTFRYSLKPLYFSGLAAVIAFALILAFLVVSLRQQSERAVASQTLGLARSLDLIFVGQINTIDVTLMAVTNEIEQQLNSAYKRPDINGYLQSLRNRQPYLEAIHATNARGDVIYGSDLGLPPSNVADRDYFTQLRDDPTLGLLVGNPVVGRIEQRWIWPFARRLSRADGSFAGVVVAQIDTAEIEKQLAQVQMERKNIITLRDKDFGLIARYQIGGKDAPPIGDRKISAKFRNAITANPFEGTYSTGTGEDIDGISGIYSYRRNPQYQFLISVGLDTDAALASWRQQAWSAFGLMLVFCAAMLMVVTLRKKALIRDHTVLLEREIFRRGIIDSVAAEIAVLDRHGVITEVNQPWQRFAVDNASTRGFMAPNTGIGTNYLEVCKKAIGKTDDDCAMQSAQGIQAVLDRRLPDFTMEYRCDSPNEQRWFMQVVTPLNLPGGGVVVAHNNITERKKADSLQREGHQMMRSILATSLDGFMRLDVRGKLLDANTQYCLLSGYTREELLGMSLPDLNAVVTAAEAPAHIERIIECGHDQFETVHRRKDGTLWDVEVSASYSEVGERQILVFLRDITERKQVEADLVTAKAEAVKANNAKSRFLAAASHDLRQPLAALSLYVGVLRQSVAAQHSDLVARIDACCTSLAELLTNLLDLSKLDAEVVRVNASDFSLDELMKHIATMHSGEAAAKGLRFHLRACTGVTVRTDQVLLRRIVNNLINNAIRYTHKGGVLVACRRRTGKLWLEVWDTGIGIPEDKTEQVFQEFEQINASENRPGSGLGLAIVAKTAALLGLQVRLQSRLGHGSMFAIELPYGSADAVPASTRHLPGKRRLRIGLVEDDAQLMAAMVLAMESAGHDVVAAASGKELLTRLGRLAPDIIISDYRLAEGETGFDVVKGTRAVFGKTLPALITTGDTDPVLMRNMVQQGISIQFKPLRIDSLLLAISEATEPKPM